MAAPSTPTVIQVMRRSFPGHFSIERVFALIRPELEAQDWTVEEVTVPGYSTGVGPRLRTALAVARLRAPVVHITGDITFAGLLRRRKGTVVTVHDTEYLDRAGGVKASLYRWVWLRLPVARAEMVTVVSDATKRDLLAAVPGAEGKVRVVPNPLAPDLFRAEVPLRPVPDRPQVLLVGARPNKNLERTLDALRGLAVRVVLVGHPEGALAAVVARSPVAVEVRRDVDGDGLRRAYEESDVLVFASTKEGFGIPILEGQGMGVPVVTSDRSPMREVAGAGGAALVDPDDAAQIRAAVTRVLSDADYRAALVASGHRNAAGYTPSAIAARYGAVYAEVVGASARRR